MEYLVSLLTGIFDNLAIETANFHTISFHEKNKISFYNVAGRDFLREVKNKNPSLKKHIDSKNIIMLSFAFYLHILIVIERS
jgi:hypothetical protein